MLVLARRLRHQVAGDDVPSATEMAVLGRIGRCGPMTPGQLARAEHVQPPSMTKVIESLEARGHAAPRTRTPPTAGSTWCPAPRLAKSSSTASKQVRSAWLASHLDGLSAADQQAIAAAAPALARLAEQP